MKCKAGQKAMNGFPSDSKRQLSLEAMVYCIIPLYHIVRISQFDPSFRLIDNSAVAIQCEKQEEGTNGRRGKSSPGEMKGVRKGSKGSKQQMRGSEVGEKEAVVRGW